MRLLLEGPRRDSGLDRSELCSAFEAVLMLPRTV